MTKIPQKRSSQKFVKKKIRDQNSSKKTVKKIHQKKNRQKNSSQKFVKIIRHKNSSQVFVTKIVTKKIVFTFIGCCTIATTSITA
jgi:hypothetical protein